MKQRVLATVALACLMGAGVPQAAQAADPVMHFGPAMQEQAGAARPEPIVTRHEGTFNGKRVRYSALVEAIDVPDAGGKPAARLVSFSYIAEDQGGAENRPVLFLFNGGPISPSIWLHMGSVGPKRIAFPDDLSADPASYKLIDNSYSLLDVADLVFIDPATTGFSRTLPGTPPEAYFSVEADAQQVSAFIVEWLKRHDRMQSPKYVLGESYGTNRAAVVTSQLAALPEPVLLDGVVLFGQALNIVEYVQRSGNIMSHVVSLPTLAALGWYHGKVERGGRSFEAYLDEVRAFARTDYLAALVQGNALDTGTRERLAARLAGYTGIPADYFRAHDLKITKEAFRAELLKEEGLLLGRADGRYTAPLTDKGAAPDPSAITRPAFEQFMNQYLREHLQVTWDAPYVTASPIKRIDEWDWGGSTPFSDWPYMSLIGKVMQQDPNLRVMMSNGIYDTMTTIGAMEYAAVQSGWPTERVSLAYYEGGHMAYTVERSAKKFADDLRAFISAGARGKGAK